MIKNWRTNIGGAISVLGTSLIGFGILPQLSGAPSKLLTYTAFIGFVLSAIGKAATALFAADAAQVNLIASQVADNTAAIATKVSK
jgi:hypothetical protein